tara:strand:+ start:17562 stop:19583 length:2022 start_codon:yes stop_codon:yes gene_type:complete
MAGTGVGKFSSTAGSNTANMTVNFAENMAPSNVNNAARELMGHMRDMYEQLGDGYFEYGDGDGTYTVARSDADTITITSSSDISSVYFAGRKIRITDGGANVVEGTIASSSHSSTTQTVNLTGISLASGTPTKVELGIDTASFGGRVILDDDGDTYIEAPTDDTIDIYAGGAKDVTISANAVNILSGTTLTIDSGATITNSGTASGFGSNVPSSADGQALGSTSAEWSDLYLADGGIIYFGNDQEVTLTHNADKGLILKHTATADDKPVSLILQTGETDMAANDVMGKIEFQAPDEGTGTDAILVAAAIQAVSEGDFSSSSNATRLEFMTGSSEAATSQMTVSSGGIVGIGAGVPGDLGVGLHIKTSDTGASANASGDDLVVESNTGNAGLSILSANNANGGILFGDDGDDDIGQIYYEHDGNNLRFMTNAALRMTISGTGLTGFNSTNSDGNFLEAINPSAGVYTAKLVNSASSGNLYCLSMKFSGQAPDDNTSYFISASDSSSGRFHVLADGDVRNADNSYGAISDERVKDQIKDSTSQWDDIKAVKVKKYKMKQDITDKGDSDSLWRLGVIAQDLEAAGMDGLVKAETTYQEGDQDTKDHLYTQKDKDTGTIPEGKDVGDIAIAKKGNVGDIKDYKSVKYSILYMKAIKALQEAQTRIETLETKVAALEG